MDVIARYETASEELPEDDTERRVLEALSSDPLHVDDLRARVGLPVSEINASLTMLELKGRARQVGAMQYVRVREARADYRVD
jgi:predicted Rossmann fold nucleotide-binding protein DprA/Smf involved in DNA uptake